MMLALFFVFVLVGGYLCGLFPSGPWVARSSLGGRHLTSVGSGGTGATNVLRYAGWGRAFLVVLLDVGKAVVAVLLARYGADLFELRFGDDERLVCGESFAAVGCLLGHCFPLWSRGFRGGKGVASMMGIVLMFAPWLFFVSLLLWLGVLGMWGFSSLASLGVCLFLLAGGVLWLEGFVLWGICGVVGIVVLRHWGNIGRLWRNQEKPVFEGLWRRRKKQSRKQSRERSKERVRRRR